MAKGFKHGAGGSNPLNFKVIVNPQPQTAKENTIWVDTDKINNYYFSAEQPENIMEYDVWFPVGTSSSGAFSATKKNPIMIYPLSAKQYISGAWVNKAAKTWQGGSWVDWWNGELFDNGNQFNFITGGWWRNSKLIAYDSPNTGTATVGNTLSVRSVSGNSGILTTKNAIDLTDFSNIRITITNAVKTGFIAVHSFETGDVKNYVACAWASKAGDFSIDISALTGKYYISVAGNSGAGLDVSKIKFER